MLGDAAEYFGERSLAFEEPNEVSRHEGSVQTISIVVQNQPVAARKTATSALWSGTLLNVGRPALAGPAFKRADRDERLRRCDRAFVSTNEPVIVYSSTRRIATSPREVEFRATRAELSAA